MLQINEKEGHVEQAAHALFARRLDKVHIQTDRLFAALMICQWLAGILVAVWISPRTWAGQFSDVNVHVWAAFILGGLITVWPVFLALTRPGTVMTRHSIAIGQMLYSALLIHLTGGRIESHFHVFGSLAFLSFYRDWKVLITASTVVGIDHLLRGIYFPQSVYGVTAIQPWRWVEHIWWVFFEDIFLIRACLLNLKEMHMTAYRQAEVEEINANIEDIVRRRTGELRKANQRLRMLADIVYHSNDAIFTTTDSDIITSWNRGAQQLFGYQAQEIIGKNVSMLVPPGKDAASISKALMSKGEHIDSYETQRVRKDGKIIDVAVTWAPMSDELETDQGCSITMRDITERKAAEQRVNEFYAVVSHELRTPVTAIRGALGLIEGNVVDINSPEAKELIEGARVSTDRLIRLINDMLDLKKIEAGKMKLDLSQVDVEELIYATFHALMGMAEEAGVSLVHDIQAKGDIYADWDKTTQILTNLMSNAIKFSKRSCRVSVTTKLSNSGRIRFCVIDTGPGIAPEDKHKLFGKFAQLDPSNTRQRGGSGLGLAISKALVEEQGGTIGVESTLGQGSEFWFELPTYVKSVGPQAEPKLQADQKSPL